MLESTRVHCDCCRCIGWHHHPVTRKQYHFVIHSDFRVDSKPELLGKRICQICNPPRRRREDLPRVRRERQGDEPAGLPDAPHARHAARERVRAPHAHQRARSRQRAPLRAAADSNLGEAVRRSSRARGERGGCVAEVRRGVPAAEPGGVREDVVRHVRVSVRQGVVREHRRDAPRSRRAVAAVPSGERQDGFRADRPKSILRLPRGKRRTEPNRRWR